MVKSSRPFLSSDHWLQYADVVVTDNRSHASILQGLENLDNPLFFVETPLIFDYADLFADAARPFRLITTCNDDISVPFLTMPPEDAVLETKMLRVLENRFLVSWHTKNPGLVHEKLKALPLGPKWQWGSTAFFGENKALHRHFFLKYGSAPERRFRDPEKRKSRLLYFNFGDTTAHAYFRGHEGIRDRVKTLLLPRFAWNAPEEFESYLRTLSRHQFCLSPPGQGIDTHRTWESLMVGTIPIVVSTPLDPLFENLPVLIVEDWSVITESFLEKEYQRLRTKAYDFSVCYAPYWDRVFGRNASP